MIDEGGIFDNALWERANGMPACRLAPDMARAMAGPEAAFVQWRTSTISSTPQTAYSGWMM